MVRTVQFTTLTSDLLNGVVLGLLPECDAWRGDHAKEARRVPPPGNVPDWVWESVREGLLLVRGDGSDVTSLSDVPCLQEAVTAETAIAARVAALVVVAAAARAAPPHTPRRRHRAECGGVSPRGSVATHEAADPPVVSFSAPGEVSCGQRVYVHGTGFGGCRAADVHAVVTVAGSTVRPAVERHSSTMISFVVPHGAPTHFPFAIRVRPYGNVRGQGPAISQCEPGTPLEIEHTDTSHTRSPKTPRQQRLVAKEGSWLRVGSGWTAGAWSVDDVMRPGMRVEVSGAVAREWRLVPPQDMPWPGVDRTPQSECAVVPVPLWTGEEPVSVTLRTCDGDARTFVVRSRLFSTRVVCLSGEDEVLVDRMQWEVAAVEGGTCAGFLWVSAEESIAMPHLALGRVLSGLRSVCARAGITPAFGDTVLAACPVDPSDEAWHTEPDLMLRVREAAAVDGDGEAVAGVLAVNIGGRVRIAEQLLVVEPDGGPHTSPRARGAPPEIDAAGCWLLPPDSVLCGGVSARQVLRTLAKVHALRQIGKGMDLAAPSAVPPSLRLDSGDFRAICKAQESDTEPLQFETQNTHMEGDETRNKATAPLFHRLFLLLWRAVTQLQLLSLLMSGFADGDIVFYDLDQRARTGHFSNLDWFAFRYFQVQQRWDRFSHSGCFWHGPYGARVFHSLRQRNKSIGNCGSWAYHCKREIDFAKVYMRFSRDLTPEVIERVPVWFGEVIVRKARVGQEVANGQAEYSDVLRVLTHTSKRIARESLPKEQFMTWRLTMAEDLRAADAEDGRRWTPPRPMCSGFTASVMLEAFLEVEDMIRREGERLRAAGEPVDFSGVVVRGSILFDTLSFSPTALHRWDVWRDELERPPGIFHVAADDVLEGFRELCQPTWTPVTTPSHSPKSASLALPEPPHAEAAEAAATQAAAHAYGESLRREMSSGRRPVRVLTAVVPTPPAEERSASPARRGCPAVCERAADRVAAAVERRCRHVCVSRGIVPAATVDAAVRCLPVAAADALAPALHRLL
eukprot:TRINITY_DN2047_c0_g3_i1.p1 TRINITY_DN2047_c0_g3~~TRINITY_DN2047_c0_g3_i1.p1  ORF type:complete len:1103 (+),score=344.70 TRINITY_DN2047_c0_g3_i1:249-3311(+)